VPEPYGIVGESAGRFTIPAVPSALKEGEVNEIRVDLTSNGVAVHDVDVDLRYVSLLGQSDHGEDNREDVPLERHSDGTTYVSVTPTHIGDVTISISLNFADELFERHETAATVSFSDAIPSLIEAMSLEGRNSWILGMPTGDPVAPGAYKLRLLPEAVYLGQPHPVAIPARAVHFTVLSAPSQAPPITVDSATGMVQSVHIGHALVMMSFKGVTGFICIDVRHSDEESSNPATCAELLPRGGSLPPPTLPNPAEMKRVMPRPQQ
jgi:hypothetical protein